MDVPVAVRRCRDAVRTLLLDAVSLGAPAGCAGCSEAGAAVCAQCAIQLTGVPHLHQPTPRPADGFPLHASAAYAGVTRSIITAWKERGRRDLAPCLAQALAGSVRAAVEGVVPTGPVSVVPIPASRSARRRRGEDAWHRVVRHAVSFLRQDGMDAVIDSCLVLVRQPRDQAGLAAGQRHVNLAGAMVCARPPQGVVVIVDDIVTTGATLGEAARALRDCGARDTRAAVIAATLRSGPQGPDGHPGRPDWQGPADWGHVRRCD
jgi:predicted amidophosphoribosyltransferase